MHRLWTTSRFNFKAKAGIDKSLISPKNLALALTVIDETCTTLSERVSGLLEASREQELLTAESGGAPLTTLQHRIASAHQADLCFSPLSEDGLSQRRLVYEVERQIVIARPGQVKHILDAIVDNALKYCPADQPIRISAFRHSGAINIAIADEGPSIAEARRASLFHPIARSGRQSTGPGPGAGLGLYLARAFSVFAELVGWGSREAVGLIH